MSYQILFYHKIGAVGIITLNRPQADNAIDIQMAQELTDICAEINYREEPRVVIITGAGEKAFCTGADLAELPTLMKSERRRRLLSVADSVANLKSTVIAAINGDAIGQGLELALACALRVAVETACFALPQVGLGLIPWDGATQRLPRVVGKTKAMEMVLAGQAINAREAFQAGLVNRVVSSKELMPMVTDMAQAMASKAPLALKYAKEAIDTGLDLTLEQGLRLEADLYFLLQTTKDRTEGVRSFLEKRPPKFKGK